MDQKLIVLYLARKGLSPREISSYLEATLGMEAVNYQSVMCYLLEARCASGNHPPFVLNRNSNSMILTKLSASLSLGNHSRRFDS
jgi:hypothetical protein